MCVYVHMRPQQQLTWDDGGVKVTHEVEMEIIGVERLRAALGSASRGDATELNAIAHCTFACAVVCQYIRFHPYASLLVNPMTFEF